MKTFKQLMSELTLTPPTDFKRSNFSNPQPIPKSTVGNVGNIQQPQSYIQIRKPKTATQVSK
jgi:hypothetical protein